MAHYRKHYDFLAAVFGHQCLACGCSPEYGKLVVDHIIPQGEEGSSEEIENLQLLCRPCNAKKCNQTVDYRPLPESAKVPYARHKRAPLSGPFVPPYAQMTNEMAQSQCAEILARVLDRIEAKAPNERRAAAG